MMRLLCCALLAVVSGCFRQAALLISDGLVLDGVQVQRQFLVGARLPGLFDAVRIATFDGAFITTTNLAQIFHEAEFREALTLLENAFHIEFECKADNDLHQQQTITIPLRLNGTFSRSITAHELPFTLTIEHSTAAFQSAVEVAAPSSRNDILRCLRDATSGVSLRDVTCREYTSMLTTAPFVDASRHLRWALLGGDGEPNTVDSAADPQYGAGSDSLPQTASDADCSLEGIFAASHGRSADRPYRAAAGTVDNDVPSSDTHDACVLSIKPREYRPKRSGAGAAQRNDDKGGSDNSDASANVDFQRGLVWAKGILVPPASAVQGQGGKGAGGRHANRWSDGIRIPAACVLDGPHVHPMGHGGGDVTPLALAEGTERIVIAPTVDLAHGGPYVNEGEAVEARTSASGDGEAPVDSIYADADALPIPVPVLMEMQSSASASSSSSSSSSSTGSDTGRSGKAAHANRHRHAPASSSSASGRTDVAASAPTSASAGLASVAIASDASFLETVAANEAAIVAAARGIPGLNQIIEVFVKILMPPVFDPVLEKLNDHMQHTMSENVAKDVSSAVPDDVIKLLEPDLKRNLTNLLPDTITATVTPELCKKLTDTLAPPLIEELVALLEPDLTVRLTKAIHPLLTLRLDKTLPRMLQRSLRLTLTEVLTRTLTHTLTPALGGALIPHLAPDAATQFLPQKDNPTGLSVPVPHECAVCAENNSPEADKAECIKCRRDAAEYSILYRAHYASEYYSKYHATYMAKAVQAADLAQFPVDEALKNQK